MDAVFLLVTRGPESKWGAVGLSRSFNPQRFVIVIASQPIAIHSQSRRTQNKLE
jgi:hypothetical protein